MSPHCCQVLWPPGCWCWLSLHLPPHLLGLEIFNTTGVLLTRNGSQVSASFDGTVAISVIALSNILHASSSLPEEYRNHTVGLLGKKQGLRPQMELGPSPDVPGNMATLPPSCVPHLSFLSLCLPHSPQPCHLPSSIFSISFSSFPEEDTRDIRSWSSLFLLGPKLRSIATDLLDAPQGRGEPHSPGGQPPTLSLRGME